MGRDVFFITTPIYYPNDVPHIGHAYDAVAVDVIARFHRLLGEEVFHLTGTDEHGLKLQRAAEKAGMTPKAWVDEMEPKWRAVWERLDIAYDDYIRTTEPRHHAAVQKLLTAVHDNGRDDIYLGSYEGLYCVACEAYYVEGDLRAGNCPIHDRPVEHMREENYFFRLSAYRDWLLDRYESDPDALQPESRRNEILSLLRSGLQDFSISRSSFTWGVPIPWDPKHVTYVWFDALTNYATAAGYADDPARFARVWPADVHMIGKDIVRFHAVYWPAMLRAAGVEPPRQVWAHGFLTVGGQKMSKTNATGIHPFDLLDHFGVDSYRYYFLREIAFGQEPRIAALWEDSGPGDIATMQREYAQEMGYPAWVGDAVVPVARALGEPSFGTKSLPSTTGTVKVAELGGNDIIKSQSGNKLLVGGGMMLPRRLRIMLHAHLKMRAISQSHRPSRMAMWIPARLAATVGDQYRSRWVSLRWWSMRACMVA